VRAAAGDVPVSAECGGGDHAAGGAVKGDTVEIQGDHRESLVARLRELGYPAKVAGG
jgi:translation initiation factor 1 (eIF-1/SUI1)